MKDLLNFWVRQVDQPDASEVARLVRLIRIGTPTDSLTAGAWENRCGPGFNPTLPMNGAWVRHYRVRGLNAPTSACAAHEVHDDGDDGQYDTDPEKKLQRRDKTARQEQNDCNYGDNNQQRVHG